MKSSVLLASMLISIYGGMMKCLAQNNDLVKYVVQQPELVNRGEKFQIDVSFDIAPNWYIYAPTGNNASMGMIETKVVFLLPGGITRAGKLKFPDAAFKNGYEVYAGSDVTMSQAFHASVSLDPGKYKIKGRVTYQTCTADLCMPPITEEIIAVISIK